MRDAPTLKPELVAVWKRHIGPHETPHGPQLALASLACPARAQSWPERPITMVVPAPPPAAPIWWHGSIPIS
jgi:hypothetical protein